MAPVPSALVTGGTGFVGRPLVRALCRAGHKVYVLARPASAFRVGALAETVADKRRVVAAHGDITENQLGLEPAMVEELRGQPLVVFHLAAATGPFVTKREAQTHNVLGTAQVLDFAAGLPRLVHFHYVSSTVVAGTFEGMFGEDELERGQRLPDAYAASKYEAERLVRGAMSELPISIYRPGVVLGDSRTGEWDRPEPFASLVRAVRRMATLPRWVPVAAPAAGALFHAAPVDYVAEALATIAARARPGKGYLLSDPAPLTWRELIEEVCAQLRLDPPRIALSMRPVGRAADLPYLRGAFAAMANRYGWPLRMVHSTTRRLTLDATNALAALERSEVRCPPLRGYLGRLVRDS